MGIRIAAYPKCYEYEIGLHRTMSVFEWIELAGANLDVDGLEMYDRFFTSLENSYLQQVADAAQQAGFVIPMFICSPDFTHPDPDERKRAIDYQCSMIEVAACLGGEGTVCRILSGQQHKGVNRAQGVQWVVEAINKVIPVARENGVVLGMENHYKDSQWPYLEFALQMEVFLEIIDAIEERQYFGVQYDPSNAIVAGDDPIELLKAVSSRVVSMHASDRYVQEGKTISVDSPQMGYPSSLCHGAIGKGLNDYEEIFRILSSSGFSGWISIEDGLNGIGEIQESANFLRKMVNKYYPN